MMSRIDRIRRSVSARRAVREDADRLDEARAAAGGYLPVPAGPVIHFERSFRDERRGSDSEFTAQLLGQDGQRRGLRAGPDIHDVARTAYCRAEYSGAFDRRPRAGLLTKKSV